MLCGLPSWYPQVLSAYESVAMLEMNKQTMKNISLGIEASKKTSVGSVRSRKQGEYVRYRYLGTKYDSCTC
jgi:hypothetical protein